VILIYLLYLKFVVDDDDDDDSDCGGGIGDT
jgi:hypothetical protein